MKDQGKIRTLAVLGTVSVLWTFQALTLPAAPPIETEGEAIVATQTEVAKDPGGIAIEMAKAFQRGDLDAVFNRFDDKMKTGLPKEKLQEVWKSLTAQLGELKSIGVPKLPSSAAAPAGGAATVVNLPVAVAAMPLNMRVSVDGDRVSGLWFLPEEKEKPAGQADWAAPSYATPSAFRESEVTIGAGGEWPLGATLTVPEGKGPFPSIVLVHGSGPHDRDETIGPNRPFKDLAWGLASRGVAVLRYEKRSKAHPEKLAKLATMTVKDETVADAAAAVRLLRQTPGLDPARVWVLGHSLGGMLAPRIAKDEPSLAGLVILAGSTRPLEKVIDEQADYLASVGSDTAMTAMLKREAAKIPTVDATTQGFVMGAPASYWLDLRGYQPANLGRDVKKPILVLQGERDYQVTMADLAGWKSALSGSKLASIKTYPKLNHLFMEGDGKATPKEYDNPGHVAAAVVDDVAAFVKARR